MNIPSLIILSYILVSIFFFIFSSIILSYFLIKIGYKKPKIANVTCDIYNIQNFEYPVVTILLPVYREEITLPYLLKSISEINYPKDKLDIQLLVEPDDHLTIKSLLSIPYGNIPGGNIKYFGNNPVKVQVWNNTIVKMTYIHLNPKNARAKPKSLNKGLSFAEGQFLIIYDAEDRPQPDQIRRMVLYMDEHPDVSCLQARLSYYNTSQSLLTKLFSIEYLNHFNILLPLMYHSGLVVLLGGTSNFFRTSALKNLDGWDEKNVTEDADLGVRLARIKGKTVPFDSTTWEEAPPKLYPWLRQRIRWNKGFLYTFKAHYKKPLTLIRDLGFKSTIFLLYQLIGPIINMLALPGWIIFSVVLLTWLDIPIFFARWIYDAYDYSVLIFYLTAFTFIIGISFILIVSFLAVRASHYALKKYKLILLMPFYNILLSVAGLVAIIEFLFKPQVWHKTYHGFSIVNSQDLS
ncbi:MAG: glycosyltransferase family 2 protein [Candidatus Nitrosocosmicus sp.]